MFEVNRGAYLAMGNWNPHKSAWYLWEALCDHFNVKTGEWEYERLDKAVELCEQVLEDTSVLAVSRFGVLLLNMGVKPSEVTVF